MKEKNIPFKNYLILAGILILSIILVIYFYMWYGTYAENKLNTAIMDKYLSIINYNELDDYLTENKDAIIYLSVLNDEEIRVFEKKFISVINFYSLNSSILYLNLSSENISDIKMRYGVRNLPCIIISRNGNIYDIYDIKENDYNIDKLTSYLKEEGIIDD